MSNLSKDANIPMYAPREQHAVTVKTGEELGAGGVWVRVGRRGVKTIGGGCMKAATRSGWGSRPGTSPWNAASWDGGFILKRVPAEEETGVSAERASKGSKTYLV